MAAPQVQLNATAVLAIVGLGVAAVVIYKGSKVAGKVAGAVADAAQAVNPLNADNVFAKGVNAVGGSVVSDTGPGRNADGSWTLGGWLYDVVNPDVAQAVKDATQPVFTGGASGEW